MIGKNPKSEGWEEAKLDKISTLNVSVPLNGYKLDLKGNFNLTDSVRKPYIDKYIDDNNLYEFKKIKNPDFDGKNKEPEFIESDEKVIKSEQDILRHILASKDIEIIDYHQYIKFDNNTDYLMWIVCFNSSQVANTPEDINKSPNIRFFIYDEKLAEKSELSNITSEIDAVQKLIDYKKSLITDNLNKISALDINKDEHNYDNKRKQLISKNKDLEYEIRFFFIAFKFACCKINLVKKIK
jgi:hypothetical protein